MKKTMLVFSFLFFLVINAYAQEDALVFFLDKENVDAALQNPISILTQKAIDRKLMHNTPIDARDVPVNETYITTLKGIPGITVFAKSKWMNCVYVRGNLQDLDALEALDFVTHLEYADKSLNLVPIPGSSTKDKLSVENKANSIVYDYFCTWSSDGHQTRCTHCRPTSSRCQQAKGSAQSWPPTPCSLPCQGRRTW